MAGLARLLALGWGAFFFFLLGFPDWKSSAYHVATPALITVAAFALHFLLAALRVRTLIGSMIFEACFAAAVALCVGWTMPMRSGKNPVILLGEGHRPGRAAFRKGLERLGLETDSGLLKRLLGSAPR